MAKPRDLPFIEMTLDELDLWRADQKQQLRKVAEIRKQRVADWHLNEAIKQLTRAISTSTKTLEQQAKLWLMDDTQTDPGRAIQARLYLRSIGWEG